MPYLNQLLPYNGATPLSRHCSAQGAQEAEARAVEAGRAAVEAAELD